MMKEMIEEIASLQVDTLKDMSFSRGENVKSAYAPSMGNIKIDCQDVSGTKTRTGNLIAKQKPAILRRFNLVVATV